MGAALNGILQRCKKIKKMGYYFLFCILYCYFFSVSAQAELSNQQKNLAKQILNDFFKVKKLTGNFTQISPKGQRSTGKFYIDRPNKMRFDYHDSSLEIVCDGKSIAVHNKNLNSWDLYRLDQTPLKFVLADHLSFSLNAITHLKKIDNDYVLGIKSKDMGIGNLQLSFQGDNHQLKGWIIVDQQNLRTKIYLNQQKQNIIFDKDMFLIPYQDIAMEKQIRH